MKRVRITEQQLANLVATKTEEVEKVNKTTEKVGGDNLVVIWPNRSSQTQYTGHLEGIKGLDTCQTGEACYMCPGPPPHMSIKPCPGKNTMREENYPDEDGNIKEYGSIEGKFEPQQGIDSEYEFDYLAEDETPDLGNQQITQSADRPDEDIPSKKKRMRGMAKELNKLAKPKPEGTPGGDYRINEDLTGNGDGTGAECVNDSPDCNSASQWGGWCADGTCIPNDPWDSNIKKPTTSKKPIKSKPRVRKADKDKAKRRPYSAKARDMRGSSKNLREDVTEKCCCRYEYIDGGWRCTKKRAACCDDKKSVLTPDFINKYPMRINEAKEKQCCVCFKKVGVGGWADQDGPGYKWKCCGWKPCSKL